MPCMQKYGETKKDYNYDGNCTLHHIQFGTEHNVRPLDICLTENNTHCCIDFHLPSYKIFPTNLVASQTKRG